MNNNNYQKRYGSIDTIISLPGVRVNCDICETQKRLGRARLAGRSGRDGSLYTFDGQRYGMKG